MRFATFAGSLVLAVLALGAPAAQARTLVGGIFDDKHNSLVTVRTNGEQARVVVDSGIRCGDPGYLIRLQTSQATVDGRTLTASARGGDALGKGRLKYEFRLKLRLAEDGARGFLSLGGMRQGRPCRSDRQAVVLHEADPTPPRGEPGPPAKGSAYYGLLGQEQGAAQSLIVRVDGRWRARAIWSARLGCAGSDGFLRNLTPPTTLDGARFGRRERFVVEYAHDVDYHYRVRFAGRFSGGVASGVAAARLRVIGADGRLLTSCSSRQRWQAALTP